MSEIIIVDVDDTCNNLIEKWIGIYNETYNDNLPYQNVSTWDITKYVKPECGKKIYELLGTPDLFLDMVEPPEHCVEVLTLLSQYYEIYFVTNCYDDNVCNQKREYLIKYFPWIDQNHIITCKDKLTKLKENKLLEKASYMIDDYEENLKPFKGIKLLLSHPHNYSAVLPPDIIRMPSWEDILMIFASRNSNILDYVFQDITDPEKCGNCKHKIDLDLLIGIKEYLELK